MVELIDHIDEIGRRVKRNVIYVAFYKEDARPAKNHLRQINPDRKLLIKWLDKNQIDWLPCYDIFIGDIVSPYAGFIFIDIPADPTDSIFSNLSRFWERKVEEKKLLTATLCALKYSTAKSNGKYYKKILGL